MQRGWDRAGSSASSHLGGLVLAPGVCEQVAGHCALGTSMLWMCWGVVAELPLSFDTHAGCPFLTEALPEHPSPLLKSQILFFIWYP